MNILFINRMMGTAWGGGENYDFNLAKGLQQMGHQVIFLTGRKPGTPAQTSIDGLEMISFETPYLRRYMYELAGKIALVPGLMAQLDLHLFRRKVKRILRSLIPNRSIDLVQILGVPELAESVAGLGMPVAMRFPGPPAWFHDRRLRRFHAKSRTAIFSHGDTVNYFRRRLGIGIEEIPPGVLPQLYSPGTPESRRIHRERMGIGQEDLVLISVGRLIEGKGHDFLLDAMESLVERNRRTKLLLVGEGTLRAQFERKIERLRLQNHVILTGHLPKEGVARCLGLSDIFCLFSDYENYSNAALEAMSCGLPVIASRVGGFPLQVEVGSNGYLVSPGDQGQFLEYVASISARPDLRQSLSAGARRFASGFSWPEAARRVNDLYERTVVH